MERRFLVVYVFGCVNPLEGKLCFALFIAFYPMYMLLNLYNLRLGHNNLDRQKKLTRAGLI